MADFYQGITDQYGNKIRKDKLTEELARPTIMGARSPISDHPAQGLTPQRLGRLLRIAEEGNAQAYLELAEEMEEKDLHYLGVLSTRKRQVSQLEISVHPASNEKNDQYNADMVRDWLERDQLQDELFDILDAIAKGFSVQEIDWHKGREWIPERLIWRDPRWFEFDYRDGTTLLLKDEGGTLEPLEPYKFVVHYHKAKSGIPIRGGLARPISWAWLFKNFDIKGWISFAESFGRPLPVGKYDANSKKEDRDVLRRAVAGLSRNAAAMIPQSMDIDFIQAKLAGSMDLHERLAVFINLEVSKAVLGQTATTDAISGGHAVSKEHNEVREDIERADAKQLAATLRQCIARPYIDLNRGPQKRYPNIVIGRPDDTDPKVFMDSVKGYVNLGGKVSARDVREKLRLKEPDNEEDILQVSQHSDTPPNEKEDKSERELASRKSGQHDAIDRFTEDEMRQWEDHIPLEEAILELAHSATDMETFRKNLNTLVGKTELADPLGNALFMARLTGEVGADLDDDQA